MFWETDLLDLGIMILAGLEVDAYLIECVEQEENANLNHQADLGHQNLGLYSYKNLNHIFNPIAWTKKKCKLLVVLKLAINFTKF